MPERSRPPDAGRRTPDARSVAWQVLNRAFERSLDPTEVLDRALRETPLAPRDRGLATELVYGISRQRFALDSLLPRYSKHPAGQLTLPLLNLARLGFYQLLYLDQVPEHAAVHETVELGKQLGPGEARLLNALMRALLRDRQVRGTDLRPPAEAALPRWLWYRWVRRLGEQEAVEAVRAMVTVAPLHLRVNRLRIDRPALLALLGGKGIRALPVPEMEEAILLPERHPIRELPGFREGYWYIQDTGAMAVGRILDPQPGERIIDLCAAPGGKTTHLAELMKNDGYIVAVDRDAPRIRLIQENCDRLGITMVETRAADASGPLNLEPADRVLADVPCSGFGAIRRQPDVLWRKSRADLDKLPARQLAILKQAARLVRWGGILVYSTCTTEPEENEEVVQRFLAETDEFQPDPVSPFLPEAWRSRVDPAGTILLWPHWSGTDGFYIVRFRRRQKRV